MDTRYPEFTCTKGVLKYLLDTGRKLYVHKTFIRRSGRLLGVYLRPMSSEFFISRRDAKFVGDKYS